MPKGGQKRTITSFASLKPLNFIDALRITRPGRPRAGRRGRGPVHPGKNSRSGAPGSKETDYGAIDLRDGGTAVPYDMEDPYLRKEFEKTLADVGAQSRMEPELYEPPNAAE